MVDKLLGKHGMYLGLIGFSCWLASGLTVGSEVALPLIEVRVVISSTLDLESPVPAVLRVEVPTSAIDEQHTIEIPGTTALRLPATQIATLAVISEGLWAAPKILLPGKADDGTRIEVFAASSVSGSIRLDQDSLPDQIELKLEQVPAWLRQGEDAGPAGTSLTCPVDADGKWDCEVPAGIFDLRLSADGKVPRYFWKHRFPGGGRLALGPISLRGGASVSGWVETEDHDTIRGSVIIRPADLTYSTDPPPPATLRQRPAVSPINERGFFQLSGIPPGGYEVEAQQKGYASMQAVPITIIADREAVLLSPLILRRPVVLEIITEPATDPWQRVWRAKLQGQDFPEIREGTLAADGRWRVEDLPAGSYRLLIENYRGDRLQDIDVEVQPDMGEFLVQLPLLRVHGKIKLGDESVAGQLWLSNGHKKIHFFVDQEKGFDAYLPMVEPPLWSPEVRLEGEGDSKLQLKSVEIEVAPGLDHAHLDLELPDTEIRGRVVDADDQPVSRSYVTAIQQGSLGALQATRTDSEGRFRLRGVAPGSVTVKANEGSANSQAVVLNMQPSQPATQLLLVLQRMITISGQVLTPGGQPQPGVQVSVLPISPPGSGPRFYSHTNRKTDLAGVFESQIPEDIKEVHLAIFSPGFAVRLLRRSVSPEQVLIIQLDQSAGRLELLFSEDKKAIRQQARGLLHRDGSHFPLMIFESWARFHDTWSLAQMVLPMMEPGLYEVCEPKPRDGSTRRCADGFLAPGGELSLSLR